MLPSSRLQGCAAAAAASAGGGCEKSMRSSAGISLTARRHCSSGLACCVCATCDGSVRLRRSIRADIRPLSSCHD